MELSPLWRQGRRLKQCDVRLFTRLTELSPWIFVINNEDRRKDMYVYDVHDHEVHTQGVLKLKYFPCESF